MSTISERRFIPAPIDVVFDEYSDHERLVDLPLVISARLTREGATERNGLGAVRRLNAGLMQLQEEVTVFDRPHLLEYRITWSFPPVRHDLGRVEFTSVPGGTLVSWTSVSSLRLLAGRLDPVLVRVLSYLFQATLRQVEERSLARVEHARGCSPPGLTHVVDVDERRHPAEMRDEPHTSDSKRVVVDYWTQVWNEADPTAPERFYADGATENGEPVDPREFAEAVRSWREKFPDFHVEVHQVLDAEGLVVSRVTYSGTHRATWAGIPATGRSFAVPGLDLWRIDEGRIVEHWHATDHLELVLALGGTVAPAS